ncbi:hypothetical protein JAAARDRAFT_123795 [Jaapia argillacea MUCL 33604]|uniref:Zn(2)-C6 fungal-type domain-containing protein n=1 Tax=Jaapia argillacea MUCL 33604 TaxID=933084 RepID=A0A067Q777_9AGAM|nr:hypothetical protein JAAARDRAFT_123795 [Jaapia argillacea MUCL 33604]
MPADLTKPSTSRSRRASRKETEEWRFDGTHAREIELKRSRGEISCAECRRLKIKCDKQIPCQSCQRRGCAALCPNGSLATGQGTRFVIAATEHLHRRIARMSERIRQLEDALAALQAKSTTEPHPLLRDDLLSANDKGEEDLEILEEPVANPPELIDAFGTLSIAENGIARFFGPTGGLEAENDTSPAPSSAASVVNDRLSRSPALSDEITMFSQSFPFTPVGSTSSVKVMIESHLPPWDRACSLCEMYHKGAGWMFHSVTPSQLSDEMLPMIYKKNPELASEVSHSGHDLALLFTILAIGALVDLSQNPCNAEAEHYCQIARAAFSLEPVLEKPSLVTIQALHAFSIYNAMSGKEDDGGETSMETTWSLVTLAAHLSQSVNRDSARWGLSPAMTERRRVIFWDLFVADVWQSLSTGRPPAFSLPYVDCKFPEGGGDDIEDQGKGELNFQSWGYRFASECVAEVAARTLTAVTPSYTTIMELDHKVREFSIPEAAATIATFGAPSVGSERISTAGSMQRFLMAHTREITLIDHPENPLKSHYAPSFLAAYRASYTILRTIRDQYDVQPGICSRFWIVWSFAFSAAVVFGTVVTRGPRSPLASAAMAELDQACRLFSKAAKVNRRAAKALPIIIKLSEKAHKALTAAQKDASAPGQDGTLWSMKEDDSEDELAIFAGKTRFISKRNPPASVSSTPAPPVVNPQPRISKPYIPPISTSSSLPSTSTSSPLVPQPVSASPMSRNWSHDYSSTSIYHPEHVHRGPASHYAHVPQRSDSAPYQWMQEPSMSQQPHHHTQAPPQFQQPHMSSPVYPPNGYYTPAPAPPASIHRNQHGFPPSELADLGLASRDSRLDERWSNFLQDSGFLNDGGYRQA